MKEPLTEVWIYALYTTLCRVFGHEYACCPKWWKNSPALKMV